MPFKKIITIPVLLVIIAIISLAIPFTVTKQVNITNNILLIKEQFISLNNLKKWYEPFNTADTATIKKVNNNTITTGTNTLSLTTENVNGIHFITKAGNHSSHVAFKIVSDSAYSCQVQLQYKATLWQQATNNNKAQVQAVQSLLNLKEQFESTKKMYGYDIMFTPVEDTTYIFTRKTVPKYQEQSALDGLLKGLIAKATQLNASYNGNRIFYKTNDDTATITLFVSVGITNTSVKKMIQPPYEFKQMPYKKNMVRAFYQGPTSELYKVYAAIDKFKSDNALVSMAIPFTKLITEGTNFSPTQTIQAYVYYPIF